MLLFVKGVEKICELPCGTFKYNKNGINFEKRICIYKYIGDKNIIYTSEEEYITIQQIEKFMELIVENKNGEIILSGHDNVFESIITENNKIYFKNSIDLSNFNFSFEVNENNIENVLNTFNEFLNWCKFFTK